MLETLMKLFDKTVPDKLKYDVKEIFRAADYWKSNFFNNGQETFSQVDIETSTDCNRACRICPRHNEPRPKALMSEEVYNMLLEQLNDMQFNGRISPVFYNEPLLDRRLPEMMRQAKESLPRTTIMLYTNGSLLNEQNISELVESGVDVIIVSQYIQNLSRDDIRQTLIILPKNLKRKIRYRIMNDDMVLSNRGGLVDVKNPAKKTHCYVASTNVTLDYQGNVVLCCNDYYTGHVFGNITQNNILDIWNDSSYKKIRKELRNGNFEYELCQKCAGI